MVLLMTFFSSFLSSDLLLGVPATERDGETAYTLPSRAGGKAEEPDRLHHLHD